MDYTKQVDAVTRSIQKDVLTHANHRPTHTISLSQTFPTDRETLWDAVTDPARLASWYAPVSGDLRVNGHYSITGNAHGQITECDPRRHHGYALSWEVGEAISAVRVTLDAAAGAERGSEAAEAATTTLTVAHTVPMDSHWSKYGPGAGGVGWDMTLAGLALHLAGLPKPSEQEWAASQEAAAFTERSSERWREVAVESGEDAKWAREAADRTTAFYIPGWESGRSSG